MNCKFTNVFMFAAGAVIGSAVTWKILKDKYEQMIQEEIQSVRESLSLWNNGDDQTESEETENEEEDPERPHQINWEEYEDLEEDEYEPTDEDLEEYDRLTNIYSSEKGGAVEVAKQPYVISPYDYGEEDGYRTISLTYYADGVLEDDDHEVINDVDELIGVGSLNTFGEYEDDSVFVRNEKLRTDFEILKDYRTYKEALAESPGRVDNE